MDYDYRFAKGQKVSGPKRLLDKSILKDIFKDFPEGGLKTDRNLLHKNPDLMMLYGILGAIQKGGNTIGHVDKPEELEGKVKNMINIIDGVEIRKLNDKFFNDLIELVQLFIPS